MLVDELIAKCERSWRVMEGLPVTVEGYLSVTDIFACIGMAEDSRESVLIPGGLLSYALQQEAADPFGGDMVAFCGHAIISGTVSVSTGLAAFPASLHDLSNLIFHPKGEGGSPITIDLKRPIIQKMEVELFDESPNRKRAVVRMQDRVSLSLVLDRDLLSTAERGLLDEIAAKHGLPPPLTD